MVRRERKRHQSKNQDPVNCLPDDMIRHILSKLGLRGIARVSTLSRRWRQVCLSLPFLNLDLQAFDIYGASSKLRELNLQYPVQYLRLYHSDSTGNNSGKPMTSKFEDERSYERFLEGWKGRCLDIWRELCGEGDEVGKEFVLEVLEICCEMVIGKWDEFEETSLKTKPWRPPNLKFFSELKEIEIEIGREHAMDDFKIINDVQIRATALKEMTIVRALRSGFVSGTDKAYKVWRRTSRSSSYVFVRD
ncbi:hypothetical protein AAG906_039985 [Vitis piasezkii]